MQMLQMMQMIYKNRRRKYDANVSCERRREHESDVTIESYVVAFLTL